MGKRLLGTLPSFLGGVIGGIVAISILGATPKSQPTQSLQVKEINADKITARELWIINSKRDLICTLKEGLGPAKGAVLSLMAPGLENLSGTTLIGSPPTLFMNDRSGNTRVALSLEDGNPHLSFLEPSGNERLVIGQTDLVIKSSGVKETTKPGSISIFDEVGNVVWREPR